MILKYYDDIKLYNVDFQIYSTFKMVICDACSTDVCISRYAYTVIYRGCLQFDVV